MDEQRVRVEVDAEGVGEVTLVRADKMPDMAGCVLLTDSSVPTSRAS